MGAKSMTPRERHLAVLHGGEPDKVNVVTAEGLRSGPTGGWVRRLTARGLGITHVVPPYRPMFFFDHMINPHLDDVIYTQTHYRERGVEKTRHAFATPAGTIFSVVGHNPEENLLTGSVEVPFVKVPSDWRIVSCLFEGMLREMKPNYEEMKRDQDTLGESGYTIAVVDKTPFQRAWIELASVERAIFDCEEKNGCFLEYLDGQRRFHERAAEITAGCPSRHILIIDNITNLISPRYYDQYCLPYYELYSRVLEGTGKVLAVHFDGLFAHLKKNISASPFRIIDSFTVPPTGNVSLSEAKSIWPEKIPFLNLAPHLARGGSESLHRGYEEILEEWGSKSLTIEHVEDLPEENLELHFSAVLDVCGY